MNLKLNFNGKTLLKNWWKTILENLQIINTSFENHRAASTLDHPDKCVKTNHIGDKAVGSDQIDDYSVGTQQIAQYAITKAKIYPGAVETTHVKDGAVTKPKLGQDVQLLLDTFEEHMDNPSQEVADNSVTWAKLDDTVKAMVRNYMNDAETYQYCGNSFSAAWNTALAYSFNSNRGAFTDAPPDNTAMPQGMIRYVLFVTKIASMIMFQLAINPASGRMFVRAFSYGNTGGWKEVGAGTAE